MMISVFDRIENIDGKGINAVFSKAFPLQGWYGKELISSYQMRSKIIPPLPDDKF